MRSRRHDTGPWSLFTALSALSLVLGLGGCRLTPPPAPPPPTGYARLAPLTALHPQQAMLIDFDHRLQTLQAARARVAAPAAAAVPPETVTLETPAPDPLDAAPPVILPTPPTPRVNEQDLTALEHILKHEAGRAQAREERRLREAYAREVTEEAQRLDRAANARTIAAAEEYRLAVRAAEIKHDLAAQRRTEAQAVLVRRPHDLQAQKRLEDAEASLRTWATEDARLRAAYDAKLQRIPRERDSALQTFRTTKGDALYDALREGEARAKQAIDTRVAEERARREALATQAPPPDTAPHVAFPPPADTRQTVNTTDLHAGHLASREVQLAAAGTDVRRIDAAIADLTARREAVRAVIVADTRAAATSVATRHGYRLSFTPADGPDLTPKMQNWLAAYWAPQTRQRTTPQ